tara:strand:+ start:13887 stop:14570 length:684 start_codon:yes stop_codon:yes gene_type:complete
MAVDWSKVFNVDAFVDPLQILWVDSIELIPNLIAATIILIIGIIIAAILGRIVTLILEKLGLDRELDKLHLAKAVGKAHVSAIIGKLVKWYVLIIFLSAFARILGPTIGTLSIPLNQFVAFLPKVIAAVLIVLVGLLTGHYVWHFIDSHSKMKGSKALGHVLKYMIIIMVTLVALRTINIPVQFIEYAILMMLGGLALAFGLGIGLSFGLGLKGQAVSNWKRIKRNF